MKNLQVFCRNRTANWLISPHKKICILVKGNTLKYQCINTDKITLGCKVLFWCFILLSVENTGTVAVTIKHIVKLSVILSILNMSLVSALCNSQHVLWHNNIFMTDNFVVSGFLIKCQAVFFPPFPLISKESKKRNDKSLIVSLMFHNTDGNGYKTWHLLTK